MRLSGDLAVGPEIHQRDEGVALVHPGREHTGQDVASHEATEARQEPHARITGRSSATRPVIWTVWRNTL